MHIFGSPAHLTSWNQLHSIYFKNKMKKGTLYFLDEFQNLPDPGKWHLHLLFWQDRWAFHKKRSGKIFSRADMQLFQGGQIKGSLLLYLQPQQLLVLFKHKSTQNNHRKIKVKYILGVDRNIKAKKNHSKIIFKWSIQLTCTFLFGYSKVQHLKRHDNGSDRWQCSGALAVTAMWETTDMKKPQMPKNCSGSCFALTFTLTWQKC